MGVQSYICRQSRRTGDTAGVGLKAMVIRSHSWEKSAGVTSLARCHVMSFASEVHVVVVEVAVPAPTLGWPPRAASVAAVCAVNAMLVPAGMVACHSKKRHCTWVLGAHAASKSRVNVSATRGVVGVGAPEHAVSWKNWYSRASSSGLRGAAKEQLPGNWLAVV